MGKLKEEMLNNQLQFDFVDDYDYEEYRKSNEYAEMVNEEIEKTQPKYSEKDVEEALKVAFKSITINPNEVGIDVFGQLIHDEADRYLKSLYLS